MEQIIAQIHYKFAYNYSEANDFVNAKHQTVLAELALQEKKDEYNIYCIQNNINAKFRQ